MERETGFEPATSTLARSHSTTELFPLERPLEHTVPQRVQPHKTASSPLTDKALPVSAGRNPQAVCVANQANFSNLQPDNAYLRFQVVPVGASSSRTPRVSRLSLMLSAVEKSRLARAWLRSAIDRSIS